ncbi:TKL protein kinase [Phytophthora cinnamomi]|uniref:TKL protein kinase n=1 Tax=Phytophthora cinnamomi TaxID=4785 RepID=UPI00355A1C1C|nr:TKL protein kinase [Phytophthora cinnamomi]
MHRPNFVSAECASGSSTLTTKGCSGCGDYDLCLGYTSKSECSGSGCETDGDCTYDCMSVDGNLTTLDVLIDFGGFRSAQETAAGGFSVSGYPDFTDTWPSASNDEVTAVGTITLSSAVETFIMSGGTAAVNYPQGKVVSVTLTSDFISSATAVTRVVLENLALTAQADDLASFLPSTVTNLELTNTLLSKFPAELSSMKSLQQLLLDYNYITSVDTLDVIGSLTTLSLEGNSIKNFTGVFTNLEYLFLGENNLTSVPTAIYKHSYLKTLNLTGNSFSVREFTREQANFLNDLETLYLSASDFTVGLECDDSEQVAIHDVTVCLGSGVTASSSDTSADATSTTKSDTTSGTNTASSATGVDGTDTKTTSSSSSSSTGMIVGVICGALVVLFALFLFVLYRRKQKNITRQKLADFEFSGTRFPSIDSDLVLQQQPYGERTSAVFGMDIPMTSTEFSMANQTAGHDDDESMGIPTSVDGSMGIPTSIQGTTAYPSSAPTEEAEQRNPDRFMSIWNDPDLLSLQVRAADVKDLKQLGNGAFAMVWLVRYRDSQLLASKRLRPERRTKKHTAMFIEEIKLIAKFDHPNLVNFVGAAWTIESDLQMLLEYMDGGDLRRYLSDPSTPIGWTSNKFDIAIGVIEALVYLHSFVPPLVHRDLKSKNVLLSSDFKAKLSDFGASRFRSVENTMTGGVGTGRWLAPEVIRGDTDYGSAADIYSFGALLTELDTNKIPYSNARGSNGKILSDMTILHRVATGKLHPEVGSDCSPALKDLVEQCLVEDQSMRPTAAVIAYQLRLIKKDMAAVLAQSAADLTLSELN